MTATLIAQAGETRFWRAGEDVYRTSGTVPGMDTYGLPMGRRWECSAEQWTRFRNVYAWAEDV